MPKIALCRKKLATQMIAVLLSGLVTWCFIPKHGWAEEPATPKKPAEVTNQAAAEAARKRFLRAKDITNPPKPVSSNPALKAKSNDISAVGSKTSKGATKNQAAKTAPGQKGSLGKDGKETEDDSPWTKVNVPDELATGIEFKKPKKGTKFAFNLVDADIVELIKIMGNITGKAFILGGKAPNIKATIYAPTRITAAEAYQAFLSVLQVNGLTVVPAGRYLKISTVDGAVQKNMPILQPGKRIPSGDQIVTRIQPLEHVSGEELADLLGRFKSADGDIMVYAPTNTLIITDYGSSIRRLLKLIALLDAPGTGEKIWIEPINHADATELSELIMEIFETASTSTSSKKSTTRKTKTTKKKSKRPSRSSARSSGSDVVGSEDQSTKISKIIPEVRTNSLIVVASENAYLRILELIKRLDVPIPGDGTLHVHKMQHADATELAKTLNNLSKSAGRATSGRKSSKSKTSGDTSASLFEGEIQISADKATNSLVIVSSLRDYISLKQVIEKLDMPQRQVFVEAVIMEVGLEKNRSVGVGFHAGSTVDSGGESTLVYGASQPTESLSSILSVPGAMSGLAAGARGPALEGTEDILGPGISIPAFGVVLQALQTNSDVNVLSTPNILATDNVEATITVGENVPIQAGYNPIGGLMSSMAGGSTGAAGGQAAALGYLGGLGGAGGFSINRQSVGITLNITPHINDDDQVRLEIKLEISEVKSIDPRLGPNISEKDAATTSVVGDQQTVVIGGLMTDNVIETTSKVPVLGDIPLLGFLFRHKSKLTKKRNLLIFLTPYIIRDSDDFRDIFYRKMAERREFIERWTAFEYHRVDPHIDWSRTKGVISEIDYIIGQAQRDEELKTLSERSTDVEHTPKPAIHFRSTRKIGAEESIAKDSVVTAGQEDTP